MVVPRPRGPALWLLGYIFAPFAGSREAEELTSASEISFRLGGGHYRSNLENPMDRGARWAAVHSVSKS